MSVAGVEEENTAKQLSKMGQVMRKSVLYHM